MKKTIQSKSPHRPIRLALAALLLLTGWSLQASTAAADAPPPGSYLLTCTGATVTNDVLNATCAKLDGSTRSTSLSDVEGCLAEIVDNGDIGNIDGNLVCIPDLPSASGITFPEAESTINQWVYGGQDEEIYGHAWGIWAGLTAPAGKVDGVPVRAFETWATPDNMIFRTQHPQSAETSSVPQRRLHLERPRQFNKTPPVPEAEVSASDGDTNILVSVAYNPPAAEHAISNKLFLQSTLDAYLANGYTEIPAFPVNSITIKPVYKVIPSNVPDGIYTMPAWPGPPAQPKAYPPATWDACVYVDVDGSGSGGSRLDEGCSNRTPENTFFLENFIHNEITEEDARYLSEQLGGSFSAGDYAILVGMHVTSREILRWTWQTFWWTPDPSKPQPPSSSAIAKAQPLTVEGAARHYAMSPAYNMVQPAQPVTGGENVGTSVYAYNPHLEAGFGKSTFQIIRTINQGTPNAVTNQYGVQTNCMSCHGAALYDPKKDYAKDSRQAPYAADLYLSRDDSVFDGTLQLDFAWSILGSLVLDGE